MRIAGYEVLGELGRGGASVVYRARSAEELVAVKVLLAAGEDAVAAFEREERLLGSFGETEGFVPLLASGTHAGRLWLAMPLLEGGTLKARLAKGPLPPDEAIALVSALARALGAAHERGVVHRDVKPANVLFRRDGSKTGDWGPPLVGDLGLAKHYRRDVPGASASLGASATGVLAGTAGYMAPELIDDARSAGPPCDVFALGVILHECLAGTKPFTAAGLVQYVRAIQEAPPPVRASAPSAPAWIEPVIARALSRDARQRFADGGALARALASGAREAARRRRARRVLAGALGALLAAAVLVAAALAALASRRAERRSPPTGPAAPPPPPAPRVDEVAAIVSRVDRLLSAHDLDGARAAASRGLALAPRNTRLLAAHALTTRYMGDLPGAIVELDRAIELVPDDSRLHSYRAACRSAGGDFAGALGDLDRAIELDPTAVSPHVERAHFRDAVGDAAGALADASRAIELDPSQGFAWSLRSGLLLAKQDLAGARADAARAIELNPLDAFAWIIRSKARLNLENDILGAIGDATRAIELTKNNVDAFKARALARARAADVEGALDDMEAAIAAVPPGVPHDFEALRADLRAKRRPGDTDAARRLTAESASCLATGDFEGAALRATRALRADLRFAEAWTLKAAADLHLGRVAESLADAARAVDLTPADPRAWAARALGRVNTGDERGALSDMTKVLELAPGDGPTLLERAKILERQGDLAGALADLESARPDVAARHGDLLADLDARREALRSHAPRR